MRDYIIPRSIPWGNTYKPLKIVLEGQLLHKKTVEFQTSGIFTDGKFLTFDIETGKPIKVFIENGEKRVFASGSFEDIIEALELPSSEIEVNGNECRVISILQDRNVKVCEEGTPISEEAWKTIVMRVSQIQ